MVQNVALVSRTPEASPSTGAGTANLDKLASQAPGRIQKPAARLLVAQATGSSAVLTKAHVQQLNPQWRPGAKRRDINEAASRILVVTHELENAGLIVEKKDQDWDTVVKPIRMGSGISIPAGSSASGEGTEKSIYDVARSGADLTFSLPNNSTILFSSNRSDGETCVEVTDKASGVTTSSTFKAVLFFDAKSQTLAFLSNAPGDKFRISDLRALVGTSDPKMAAALRAVGLDTQR